MRMERSITVRTKLKKKVGLQVSFLCSFVSFTVYFKLCFHASSSLFEVHEVFLMPWVGLNIGKWNYLV